MDNLGKGSAAPQMTGRRRWALLATVGAGLLLITLDNSILYTALPTLTSELDATGAQSLWVINAYPVVMAGLLLGTLVTTWLLRRHGPGSQSQLSAEEAYADAPHPTPVRETRPDAYAGTRAIRQSVQAAGGAGVGSVGRERSHRHG
ncbi:MFS transporter [Micrococcus luteus]